MLRGLKPRPLLQAVSAQPENRVREHELTAWKWQQVAQVKDQEVCSIRIEHRPCSRHIYRGQHRWYGQSGFGHTSFTVTLRGSGTPKAIALTSCSRFQMQIVFDLPPGAPHKLPASFVYHKWLSGKKMLYGSRSSTLGFSGPGYTMTKPMLIIM